MKIYYFCLQLPLPVNILLCPQLICIITWSVIFMPQLQPTQIDKWVQFWLWVQFFDWFWYVNYQHMNCTHNFLFISYQLMVIIIDVTYQSVRITVFSSGFLCFLTVFKMITVKRVRKYIRSDPKRLMFAISTSS